MTTTSLSSSRTRHAALLQSSMVALHLAGAGIEILCMLCLQRIYAPDLASLVLTPAKIH